MTVEIIGSWTNYYNTNNLKRSKNGHKGDIY